MWQFHLPDLTIPMLPDGAWDATLPPLLRIPPAIRERIYRHVGLASWDGTAYQFDLGGNQPGSSLPELRTGWRGFHGLLQTCHLIHDEAVGLLYSANKFSLYYCWTTGPRSLDPLHALTTPALAALSDLKIVLNQASCHQAEDMKDRFALKCCKFRTDKVLCTYHGKAHHAPLLAKPSDLVLRDKLDKDQRRVRAWRVEGIARHRRPEEESMLSAWQLAARALSQTTAGRLELALVCDIHPSRPRALQVARSVVAPLQTLPRSHLRRCHIRLSATPDARLHRLARDIVLHACDMTTPYADPSDGVSWLTRLPAELRIRILEHTDLVTPWRGVDWTRDGGVRQYQGRDYRPLGERWSSGASNHADQFSGCWSREPRHGCFCHARHGAFSPNCRCWRPPGATLFLVCRALTRDARFVFFSCNRFVVYDLNPVTPWKLGVLGNSATITDGGAAPYAHARLAISEFLREAVPDPAVPHLRYLELHFRESIPPNWPGTEHPAMPDWRETVEWLRGRVGAHSLAVRVYVCEVGLEQSHYYGDRRTVPEEAKPVLQAYDDLVTPLRGLVEDGLTDFSVHMSFPFPLPGRHCGYTQGTNGYHQLLRDGRRAVDERAMRLVLGDPQGKEGGSPEGAGNGN